MTRLQRIAGSVLLPAVLIAAAAAFATPASGPESSAPAIATIGSIADQLGVKVSSRQDDEFTVGTQFTGNLVDPAKLSAFGIKGMHAGARVVAARIAADKVYVEADELDPPARAFARLALDADGRIVKPPRV